MACDIPSWDAALPGGACDSNRGLLAEDDTAASERWQTLDDAGLDQEIELHRRSLRDVAAQLDALGARHPAAPAEAAATAAAGTAATRAGEDGTAGDDSIAPHGCPQPDVAPHGALKSGGWFFGIYYTQMVPALPSKRAE